MQQYIKAGSKHILRTQGVCSKEIRVELEGDMIKDVSFVGGCDGNLKAVAKLSIGRNATEVIESLKGIRCGFKSTSCPDQLTKVIKIALQENARRDEISNTSSEATA